MQFRGPLASHGSPWQVSEFHNYLYAFVTPSGALLFHTSSSAAAAASYPEPRPEYLAYLGWPLLVVAIVAAVRFWRDPKVRLTAVTFALLELFSLGAASVTFHGIRYPAALLPWHWLQGLPVLADALPDRLSILADGAVAALLAFALDRARGRARLTSPSGLMERGRAWGPMGYVAAAVVVLAILPLVPLPLPAANVGQAPAGWQEAFAGLRLASDAHVLVIPDERNGMGWQAETGVPGSMVGGGALIEPNRSGQATSYIYNRRPTVEVPRGALRRAARRARALAGTGTRRSRVLASGRHRRRHHREHAARALPDRRVRPADDRGRRHARVAAPRTSSLAR